ncbi:hypothetical protein [Ferrimonas lipolytica]|uniref:Uncharacterized protein n=1 Tax=Ferrimonas lipolytica TaxID=2724191 RepID=A0A6H1UGF9_9GAMM|nr:hypothetical protein [Ferrimonas lipolytica]QIZ78171.1 hypothetical protein HER31_15435 [Ferrimonas lipolytica]
MTYWTFAVRIVDGVVIGPNTLSMAFAGESILGEPVQSVAAAWTLAAAVILFLIHHCWVKAPVIWHFLQKNGNHASRLGETWNGVKLAQGLCCLTGMMMVTIYTSRLAVSIIVSAIESPMAAAAHAFTSQSSQMIILLTSQVVAIHLTSVMYLLYKKWPKEGTIAVKRRYLLFSGGSVGVIMALAHYHLIFK